MMKMQEIQKIFESFLADGKFLFARAYGSGHINDTYLINTDQVDYILQRVNHFVFPEVEKMNDNIIRALEHFNVQQNLLEKARFRELKLFLSSEGKNHFLDEGGNYWRLMNLISDSFSLDVAETPEQAFEAAKAFAYFQKLTIGLEPKDFFPVIQDFHNLDKRLNHFMEVLNENPAKRNGKASPEIDFVLNHQGISHLLKELLDSKKIPIRVTHNDTKINNVLLDKKTEKGIAVIDLDTLMPGTVLFDFGDMVRTFTSPAEEDETDLSKVVLRLPIFEALAKGYLSQLKDVITQSEKEHLVFGGKIMTFMIGLRFLTDFLEGDVYFKTSRPEHNLDRCRTQFKLLEEIENQEAILTQIVQKI
jgi:Phosphotransferase enzyme family